MNKQLPWTQDKFRKANQVELLEMIKSKNQNSICFPKDTSPELQDLILGMIRCDKEERLSWEQVFSHPVLKTNTAEFEKSQSTSDLFPVQSFDFSIIPESKGDLSHVVARLEFERNLNLLTFNAIKKLQYFMLEVNPFLYMRLNFLMAKKIYMSYENLKEMFMKKTNVLNIKQSDWIVFLLMEDLNIEGGGTITKYYKELVDLKKTILKEADYAKETFVNFKMSILAYNQRNNIASSASKPNFLDVLNDDVKFSDDFDKIYVQTIKEFLKSMKKNISDLDCSTPAGKNMAYLVDEMWILTDTNFFKLGDDEYVNLQRFYELRRQSDIYDILERINEAYNHFKL